MTKNSLCSKRAEGKGEQHRQGLTRADELLGQANLLSLQAAQQGSAALQALAELRTLDALDQLVLDAYAPVAAPARGDLIALALTLEALDAIRLGGRRGDG